jgi:predicted glutamine amidotransferase
MDDKPVNNLVKFLYFNQKERGKEGYGFVGLNASRLDTYRATTEAGFLGFLDDYHYDEVILHHRLPTSTGNTLQTTHPFVIERHGKEYYFVHNGIIANSDELQAGHERQGIVYSSLDEKKLTFNDSEALAWEFILWLHGEQKTVQAQGSAAFVCLETDRQTRRAQKLYFYCNAGSPLKVYRDKTLLVLASEGNWGMPVQRDKVWYYDYARRKIAKYKDLAIEERYSWQRHWYQFAEYEPVGDWETADFKREIAELTCERDYLIRTGDYEIAEELQDEIDYLGEELAELQLQEARVDF